MLAAVANRMEILKKLLLHPGINVNQRNMVKLYDATKMRSATWTYCTNLVILFCSDLLKIGWLFSLWIGWEWGSKSCVPCTRYLLDNIFVYPLFSLIGALGFLVAAACLNLLQAVEKGDDESVRNILDKSGVLEINRHDDVSRYTNNEHI